MTFEGIPSQGNMGEEEGVQNYTKQLQLLQLVRCVQMHNPYNPKIPDAIILPADVVRLTFFGSAEN